MPKLRLLPPATVVDTDEKAAEVLSYLMNRGGYIAIDTETTGLDKFRDRILYWSMATERSRYFLEVKYLYYFDRLFQNKKVKWRLANAKFDMHQFASVGVSLAGEVRDIIVQDAMVDDTRPHGLKEQAFYNYEVRWGDFKDLFLSPERVALQLGLDRTEYADFKKMPSTEKLPYVYSRNPGTVIDYASCDAYFTYMLGEDLDTQMGATELPTSMFPELQTLGDYFDLIEVPLTKSLFNMERRGVAVDMDYVKKIDQPMRDGLVRLESEISTLVGKSFNPRSTDDIGEFLFKTYNIKPVSFTKGGDASTGEKDMNRILERVDPTGVPAKFIRTLMEYKTLQKLHGTYVKKVHTHLGPDGRVHCTFNQTGARTSRLSSTGPNMQNIPAHDDAFKLRGMFVAPKGRKLVDLDYPQIEFRVAACLAGEEGMMEAIRKGWDIHTANAASTFAIEYDDIVRARAQKDLSKKDKSIVLTDQEKWFCAARDRAKAIGLGTMFGQGAGAIAATLGIKKEVAQEGVLKFFSANPKIDELISYMHQFGRDRGFTHTMLGRMRQLHRINCGMKGIEAMEERQAFNMLIQGSAAEMMKLAILRIDADPRLKELDSFLCLTVHDELISESPTEHAAEVKDIKTELMGDPYRWGPIQLQYPVPIAPDGAFADRWSEAK